MLFFPVRFVLIRFVCVCVCVSDRERERERERIELAISDLPESKYSVTQSSLAE